MALILPKGIVVNSAEANHVVERINTEPLDLEEIAKFWKVYTTTKRRLLDPTAERLENYWWRIWGSRRRELKGAIVARLFAYISDGHSFVPLRGPLNRDEGTPPLNTIRRGPGAVSSTGLHHHSPSRPSLASSTASKAPLVMPHPILKKTRGPSTTGPRPTARFISPHDSDAETGPPCDSPSRSVSPNSHVIVQPPSPDSKTSRTDRKTAVAGGGKKKGHFFASTAAKKKRPVIVKRQSSQSSVDGSGKMSAQSTNSSSTERTLPTFSEGSHSEGNAPQRLQENFSSQPLQSPKRHSSSKSTDAKRASAKKPGRKRSSESSSDVIPGGPGPSSRLHYIENQQVPTENLTEEEKELQQTLLNQANAHTENNPQTSPEHTSNETQSDHLLARQTLPYSTDSAQDQDMGAVRLLPHEAKGTASLAPTLTDATGQLDLCTTLPQLTSAKGKNKGKGRDSEDLKRTELFAKRAVPPILGPTASDIPDGSLARSKSQLTLLLEKDRAHTMDKKSRREKKE